MDRLLASIPRPLLVFILLTAGTLLAILSDPPKTVCDAQMEAFRESQQDFLFRDDPNPNDSLKPKSLFEAQFANCRDTNSPGGCVALNQSLRLFLTDFSRASSECLLPVGQIPEAKTALRDSLELFVRIAWGDQPPTGAYDRLAWLSASDLYVYCGLKQAYLLAYGDQPFQGFQERMLTTLPGQASMSREDIWSKSLLSLNCRQYR